MDTHIHQSSLQNDLPVVCVPTDSVPSPVVVVQPLAQLGGTSGVLGVIRQVGADVVQRPDDALVAVQVQQELLVVLDDVLELLDVAGRRGLGALDAFGRLQPLLQAPQVVVQLGPVAFRAQRAEQSSGLTVTKNK